MRTGAVAAFEAWYGPDQTSYPPELGNNQWPQDKLKAWEAYQAALESPEVQGLRDALQEVVDAADGDGWNVLDTSLEKQRAALAAMEK